MVNQPLFYANSAIPERLYELRMLRGSEKAIAIELAGILNGATVESVTWDAANQCVARLKAPAIDGTRLTAGFVGVERGLGDVEARVALSDGSMVIQRISVWVQ